MNYNLVSVIFGVFAILIPIIGLKFFKKASIVKQLVFLTASLILYDLAAGIQILKFKRIAEIGVHEAIIDTAGSVGKNIIVLIVIVALANFYCISARLLKRKEKTTKETK